MARNQLEGEPEELAVLLERANVPIYKNNIENNIDLSQISDSDLRREATESLVLMMRNNKGDLKALGAIKELLDRIEGRPVQRQVVHDANSALPARLDKAIQKRRALAEKKLLE